LKLISIVLAALALAIAGCGDDEEPDPQPLASGATGATGESGALDKSEFIAEADAICDEADNQLAAEARDQFPEGPPTGDDAVAFGEDVVIPNLQGQHDAIAALPAPEGEEETVADLLAELQAGIDELAEDPGDFVESTALADAAAAAREFGLKRCGGE
jgi:hypothetical protein